MHQDPVSPDVYRRRRLAALGAGAAGLIVLLVLAFVVFRNGDDATVSGNTNASSSLTSTSTTSASPTTDSNMESAGACPDTSIAVKSTVDHPNYKKGDEPVFGIVVTNISTQACDRDFGSNQQSVTVYTLDGSKRIWSNLDCTPDPDPRSKVLQPGKQEVAQVKWQGTTSAPNCDGERLDVAPGAYSVVAQLGAVKSNPEPFNIG
ncbi:MAG: hypothetical protein LLG14_04740 [Nocardiaceae bacterium]|nr:hypothetical protein [Nocardiaceae bacterium]